MKFIPEAVTQHFGRTLLQAQKHSPRVLFVAGVAGVVTSTVLACRATLKMDEVLDSIEHDISSVKALKNPDNEIVDSYDDRHYNRDLAYVYFKSGYRIVRLYGPAVVIGSASIAALTSSHIMLSRRNASLTAAYAAVSKGFDEYRARVRHELGEEKELDLYRGVTEVEDPKTKEIKKVVDPNKLSPYSVIFDESNPNFQKNAEINKVFLLAQQNYLNNLLHARGHVFLNEVLYELGFEHTTAGAVVGWLSPNKDGDNYIDFGLFDAYNSRFVNGDERSIILDFNVDGVIYDKI